MKPQRRRRNGEAMKKPLNANTAKPPETLLSVSPVKDRTQTFNPHSRRWIKRDEKTGQFCGVKKDGEPWRRVQVEENTPVIALGW
jgi:hypothetical protein